MSGHSKWSTIKRKKAGIDAARGKKFTKLIREITIAAREGGGDPEANPRLSLAVENAKAANMPKDNMERAIKKGTGELDTGEQFEEVTYEGYGSGGVAYFVDCTTDNVNRTVSDIRHIFSKYGGNLGTNGSVAYLFSQKGVISIPAKDHDVDEIMLTAIDAGAEDVNAEDDAIEVTTAREDLYTVRKALESAGYKIDSAELQRIPATYVQVDQDHALSNFKLMDALENNDDVTDVFNNMEMDEATMEIADKL
jgi:YebC/PmpR family DNA-binding regulatory protein